MQCLTPVLNAIHHLTSGSYSKQTSNPETPAKATPYLSSLPDTPPSARPVLKAKRRKVKALNEAQAKQTQQRPPESKEQAEETAFALVMEDVNKRKRSTSDREPVQLGPPAKYTLLARGSKPIRPLSGYWQKHRAKFLKDHCDIYHSDRFSFWKRGVYSEDITDDSFKFFQEKYDPVKFADLCSHIQQGPDIQTLPPKTKRQRVKNNPDIFFRVAKSVIMEQWDEMYGDFLADYKRFHQTQKATKPTARNYSNPYNPTVCTAYLKCLYEVEFNDLCNLLHRGPAPEEMPSVDGSETSCDLRILKTVRSGVQEVLEQCPDRFYEDETGFIRDAETDKKLKLDPDCLDDVPGSYWKNY